jgi:hypothetical protein
MLAEPPAKVQREVVAPDGKVGRMHFLKPSHLVSLQRQQQVARRAISLNKGKFVRVSARDLY